MSAVSRIPSRFTKTCLSLLLASGLSSAQAGVLSLTESIFTTSPTPCIDRALTTPNGKFTYANAFCSDRIFIYSRDLTTGKLTQLDAVLGDETTGAGLRSMKSLAISPDGKFVFAYGVTGKTGDTANPYRGVIFVYQINSDTGALTFKSEFEVNASEDLKISPDGNYLYALSQSKIEVLGVAGNGQLSSAQEFAITGTGFNLSFNPDASRLYVAFSTSAKKIAIYDRDAASGQLTNARVATIPGIDDEAPAISPDGKFLYSFVNSELAWFSIGTDGGLTAVSSIAKPPAEVAAKFYCPTNILISPNGRLAYFVDQCAENMQVWLRDPTTGGLEFAGFNDRDDLDIPDDAFQQTDNITFTPDFRFSTGAYIYGITTMELTADTQVIGTVPTSVAPGATFEANIELTNLGGATAHQIKVLLKGTALANVKSISVTHPMGECHAQDADYVCTLPKLVKSAGEVIELELIAPASAAEALTLQVTKDQAEIDHIATNDTAALSVVVASSSSSSSLVSSSAVSSSSSSIPPSSATPSSAASSSSVAVMSSAAASTAAAGGSGGGGGSAGLGLLASLLGLVLLRRRR